MIGPEHTRSFDTSEMLFYCWYSLTKKKTVKMREKQNRPVAIYINFLTVTTAGIRQPEQIFSQVSSAESNYKFEGERRKQK
jgi:hypothetical protein